MTDDSKGIWNFLALSGYFVSNILPYFSITWRTVGDIIGSNVPLEKDGENKLANP